MSKPTLNKLQSKFAWTFAKLIIYAQNAGYLVTLGRTFVTPEQNRLDGGINGSLHCLRLAADINLFREGTYLRKTEDYAPLGEWWEAQGPEFAWGGRFSNPDGNHFSIRYNNHK